MTSQVMATMQLSGDSLLMTTTQPTSTGTPGTATSDQSTTCKQSIDRHGKYIRRPGTRRFLLADAALTGINGLAYVVLAGILGEAFGIQTGLLIGLGIFLLIVAAEVAVLATRTRIPRLGVQLLAEVNAVWVVASVAFAAVADLTMLGVIWVIAQALIVAAFALHQLRIAKPSRS